MDSQVVETNAAALQRYLESFASRNTLLRQPQGYNDIKPFVNTDHLPEVKLQVFGYYHSDLRSQYGYASKSIEDHKAAEVAFRDLGVMAKELRKAGLQVEYRAETGVNDDPIGGRSEGIPRQLVATFDLSDPKLATQLDAALEARRAAFKPATLTQQVGGMEADWDDLSPTNVNIVEEVAGKISEQDRESARAIKQQHEIGKSEALAAAKKLGDLPSEEKRDLLVAFAEKLGVPLPKSAIPLRPQNTSEASRY